ncbi:hypothetical protein FAGKG844_280063 [Frankia sp. AgKG'84/4]
MGVADGSCPTNFHFFGSTRQADEVDGVTLTVTVPSGPGADFTLSDSHTTTTTPNAITAA